LTAFGWKQIALTLGGLVLVALSLVAVGVMPWDALVGLVHGSVGTKNGWNETLKQTTPLIIAGLAVLVALRAGLFNIGAEGQILVGALAGTAVGLQVGGPLGTALALAAGCAAGALWALPAGLIKAYRNGHEVITTIMLNSIAGAAALWIVNGPLRNSTGLSTSTDPVQRSTWIPPLLASPPFKLMPTLPFALLFVWLIARWLKRSVAGYELCATGAGARAARVAGIDTKRVTVSAMAFSGGLAGLAGALQVFAHEHNFFIGFSSNYGFNALGVALLAGSSPWGVVPSSFLFGALDKGTSSLQIMGVPKGLSEIVLAIIIIVFAAYRYRRLPSHE
jgi:simple sugar transport system permease protein